MRSSHAVLSCDATSITSKASDKAVDGFASCGMSTCDFFAVHNSFLSPISNSLVFMLIYHFKHHIQSLKRLNSISLPAHVTRGSNLAGTTLQLCLGFILHMLNKMMNKVTLPAKQQLMPLTRVSYQRSI